MPPCPRRQPAEDLNAGTVPATEGQADKSESDEYLRGRIANLRKMAMVCREESKSAKAPNSVISLSVTDEALRKRFAASTEYLEILDAAKGAIEVASQIAKLEDKPESCLLAYHPYLAADPAYSNVAHALRRLETQEKIVAILRSPPIRIDERWEASLNAWATPEETTSMERATFAIRMTSKIAGADWPNNPAKRNAQIKSDLADDLRYARMDLDSVKYDLTAAAESCPIGLEILKQEPCHAAATTALNSRLQSLHALSSRHHEVVAEYVEQENRRRINEAKKFESMAYDLEARLERRQKEREEAERAEARAREERKRQAKIQAERDLGPRAYLENRGVPCLLHFTRTAYLPAILREGLLSRAELEHRHPRTRFNDLQRLDGEPDTISCSIGHPNAATLHRFRERAGPDTWWCIIAIKLAVLDQQPAL